MKTRHYICICFFILYNCISFYGAGIERGLAVSRNIESKYEKADRAQKHLIDILLLESGREPMYNTRQELNRQWNMWNEQELFNKENWQNG